jgi:uncharacterized protein (UPF0297 family)
VAQPGPTITLIKQMQQYCIDIENASIKNRKKLAEKIRALARYVIIWYLIKTYLHKNPVF